MKHCLLWQWLHEVLAPGYSLWDQLGKLCKKHNNRVGLWRLAWRWKKSDDCPLSETLKAPHFYRRRNHVFVLAWHTIRTGEGLGHRDDTGPDRDYIPHRGRLHIPYRLKQCFAYKNPVIGVNVVKAINHPPVITFFLIGGIFTSPKWVVYGIVLTTW